MMRQVLIKAAPGVKVVPSGTVSVTRLPPSHTGGRGVLGFGRGVREGTLVRVGILVGAASVMRGANVPVATGVRVMVGVLVGVREGVTVGVLVGMAVRVSPALNVAETAAGSSVAVGCKKVSGMGRDSQPASRVPASRRTRSKFLGVRRMVFSSTGSGPAVIR